uniref:Phosphoglucomutase n=1 Tax=Rhizophora mucronata TaxID=61149 RepID=A0A2P2IPE0_RHIMU
MGQRDNLMLMFLTQQLIM